VPKERFFTPKKDQHNGCHESTAGHGETVDADEPRVPALAAVSPLADDVGDLVWPLQSGVEKVFVVVEQQPLEAVVDRPQHVGPVVILRVLKVPML